MNNPPEKPEPTYETCPRCDGMIVTDGLSYWCEEDDCTWGLIQASLFANTPFAPRTPRRRKRKNKTRGGTQ